MFHQWWDTENPNGTVVIAHGASEHMGRYGRFADALNAAGWAVAALDHRGHGKTRESTGTGRFGPSGAEGLLDDLDQLVEITRERAPDKPVVVFGHSMGSVIVQAYVVTRDRDLAGYVLSGPLGVAEGGDELLAGIQQALDAGMADEPVSLLGQFNEPFEPARTPFDWLSRDPAEVDKYLADPLCGDDNPLTYGYIAGVMKLGADGTDPQAISAMAEVPVLLVAGEMDPAGGMTSNVRALEERLRGRGLNVTAMYYPDARHEVLNETNRDEVTEDICNWLGGLPASEQ